MAIEMVDFPIDSMLIVHSYVAVYQRVPQRVKVYMTGRGKKVELAFSWDMAVAEFYGLW